MFRPKFYPGLIHFFGLFALLIASPLALYAQTTETPQAPPDLTRPTVLSRPASGIAAPSLDESAIPSVGMTGILVETLEGQMVMEQLGNLAFNPASAVKLATALAALRTFGPEHRFTTAVWTTGTIDKATGTVNGDLIISGRDPSFHYEHAVMIARELNRMGIRTVTGDLIVAPRFTMNFNLSAQRSGDSFYDTLDATRRPAAASRAWMDERTALRDTASLQSVPSVAVMGAVYVDAVPKGAKPIMTHSSSKLVDVLKVLLCYSNNFMAERIGDTMGGPEGVRRVAIRDAGVNPAEISLATTSGLGVNRVTPRAMMKIFRALRTELAKAKLSPSDIMPVAGIDPGTLQKRYTSYPSRGSVIAKTGTLIRTDGGVSALVGQMKTARGETLLFVIFNQRGSFLRFRESQDMLVTQLQNQRGGPAAFDYRPQTLSMRLADTEQSAMTALSDEYEPGTR
ncbi:MAG TPA: D-alanyl-D-alanine carboxypeptidase [Pyrinomonadaceae bacterium]|nr:D-alanyl-D-alanine carboxypeptidase [Pyrinomonadaceae bacterium]